MLLKRKYKIVECDKFQPKRDAKDSYRKFLLCVLGTMNIPDLSLVLSLVQQKGIDEQ